jgi:hypothetical protein
MKVFVFQAVNHDSPALFVARIRCPMIGKKGVLVETWHPVIFEAQTYADAERRATEWWNDEVAKERQKVERGQALARRRAEGRA